MALLGLIINKNQLLLHFQMLLIARATLGAESQIAARSHTARIPLVQAQHAQNGHEIQLVGEVLRRRGVGVHVPVVRRVAECVHAQVGAHGAPGVGAAGGPEFVEREAEQEAALRVCDHDDVALGSSGVSEGGAQLDCQLALGGFAAFRAVDEEGCYVGLALAAAFHQIPENAIAAVVDAAEAGGAGLGFFRAGGGGVAVEEEVADFVHCEAIPVEFSGDAVDEEPGFGLLDRVVFALEGGGGPGGFVGVGVKGRVHAKVLFVLVVESENFDDRLEETLDLAGDGVDVHGFGEVKLVVIVPLLSAGDRCAIWRFCSDEALQRLQDVEEEVGGNPPFVAIFNQKLFRRWVVEDLIPNDVDGSKVAEHGAQDCPCDYRNERKDGPLSAFDECILGDLKDVVVSEGVKSGTYGSFGEAASCPEWSREDVEYGIV